MSSPAELEAEAVAYRGSEGRATTYRTNVKGSPRRKARFSPKANELGGTGALEALGRTGVLDATLAGTGYYKPCLG